MVVEDYSYPFEKGKPSLFVIVGSPFQALCAIEAIRDFEILDYKFLVCLSNWKRDDQTLAVLNKYNIKYECVNRKNVLSLKGRLSILRFRKNRYKRIFVGDFRSLQLYYCALRHASNNSTIISLDDGACNVSLLNNVYKLRIDRKIRLLSYWYFDFVAKIRSVKKGNYLYTLFSDIPNSEIKCFPNQFRNLQLLRDSNNKIQEGVYFVGTNTSSFAKVLSLELPELYRYIDGIFDCIYKKHVNERIVFVPHGADNDPNVKDMCKKYHFEYDRPETLIELYLLNLNNPPRCIYGFASTALFTIKKMFPKTDVFNILFHGSYPYYERRKTVSDYYTQHGINTIAIDL